VPPDQISADHVSYLLVTLKEIERVASVYESYRRYLSDTYQIGQFDNFDLAGRITRFASSETVAETAPVPVEDAAPETQCP